MTIGKVLAQDLNKLIKVLSTCRTAYYVQVSIDGPKILFTFPDDSGKIVTVTLFDDSMQISPTVTRTETIL